MESRIDLAKFKDFIKTHPISPRIPSDSSINQYILQIGKLFSIYPTFLDEYHIEKEECVRSFVFGNRSYVRKFALTYLFKFLNMERESQFIDKLYVKKQERRYENQFLKPEEIKTLVNEITDKKASTLIKVIFETASRSTAALRLELAHIKQDEDGDYYILMREKGNKRPKKYLQKETALELLSIAPETGRIFQKNDNTIEEDYYEYWKLLKEESKRILGSEYGISFHWIRRSRAVYMRLNGFDLTEIQHMLSHKSISTTQIYITKEVDAENKTIIQKDRFRWNRTTSS